MNSKRRAELQRKLSMGAVPRPPADLSDRIKADIPQYLRTDEDRDRFTGSVAFSMRVAASILLLITTAFVTLRLLEPETKQTASLAPRPKLVPAVTRYQTSTSTTAAPERQAAAEEVRLDIAEEILPVPASAPPAAPRVAPVAQVADAAANRDAEGGVVGGVAGGFAEEIGIESRIESRVEQPAAIAEMPPAASDDVALGAVATQLAEADAAKSVVRERRAAAPAPVPAPSPAEVSVAAGAPLISVAHADELPLRQKSEVFGISVDPNVFDRVKGSLQKGTRPPAASVNVDALVNYFAGPPARAPRRVSLEVEASPAPVEAEGDHAILRFTIDTPRIEVGPRESTPPAAADARIEIEFDKKAVANFRRIGTGPSLSPESMLLHNLSVTGLYQIELRPGLKGKQHVATVRLKYRSITNGKPQEIVRVIRGSDLARDWARASRRHRLASLGAVWSESLKAGSRIDVARRAEELATQEPKDSRARELANAANATAGGGKR